MYKRRQLKYSLKNMPGKKTSLASLQQNSNDCHIFWNGMSVDCFIKSGMNLVFAIGNSFFVKSGTNLVNYVAVDVSISETNIYIRLTFLRKPKNKTILGIRHTSVSYNMDCTEVDTNRNVV